MPALTLKLFLSFNQHGLEMFLNPKRVILFLGCLEVIGEFIEKGRPSIYST